MRTFNLFILFLLCSTALMQAQNGKIRGTVYENETGQPLFSANVVLKGTTNGTTTDFDGKFELNATPGSYAVEISFIGLSSTTITDVEIKPGEVTVLDNIKLKPASSELAEVTVTAEALKNTEEALLTVKRKSANVLDGISATRFKQVGDGNASEAIKRVPGVSVEGGKYVYVRGLGDRYTKTTINGMTIPGLDPDRNSLQIDIFPTALISNMTVLKSAVAELSADFTGGIVNIETQEFPSRKIFNVSVGVGYNPSMHFNNDYVDYDGSNTDFLGFDGGRRQLPDAATTEPIPSPAISGFEDPEINQFLNEFDPNLAANTETSPMNFDLGLSLGDQYKLENGHKLGYIFTASYKNSTTFYNNALYGEYQNVIDPTVKNLQLANTISGRVGINNVLLAGLGGVSYKTANSKYKFTVMNLQNGERRAAKFSLVDDEDAVGNSGFIGVSDNLEYNERRLTNLFLSGDHHFNNDAWVIDWAVSPTFSRQEDPDIRKTAFTIIPQGTGFRINAGEAGLPSRLWRNLEETSLNSNFNVTRQYSFKDRDAKLKFGLSHLYKQRDYEILSFLSSFFGAQPTVTGDPNELLQDDKLYPNGTFFYASQNGNARGQNPNKYGAAANNTGIYVSNEFEPFLGFKAILGLRGEYFIQTYEGAVPSSLDIGGENAFVDETVLDNFDLFPSANLIYALNENMNLRASYYRSIARPSFKEMSFAQILDPVSNRTFNGGLFPITTIDTTGGQNTRVTVWDGKLSETYINNLDIRWELFMGRGEILSFGAFYKTFNDPIELVRIASQITGNDFQPRNVGDGQVIGLEMEVRKSLGFISPLLKNLSFNGNFTWVDSEIDMSPTEFDFRKSFEKEGQNIDDTRDMAGQAPYIVNAGLNYNWAERKLNAGVFYNVQGPTLAVVGGGLFPDVYTEPFHNLKININKTMGGEEQFALSLEVANILNDDREQFFQAFEAQNQLFSAFNPGTTISAGFTYKIQ